MKHTEQVKSRFVSAEAKISFGERIRAFLLVELLLGIWSLQWILLAALFYRGNYGRYGLYVG